MIYARYFSTVIIVVFFASQQSLSAQQQDAMISAETDSVSAVPFFELCSDEQVYGSDSPRESANFLTAVSDTLQKSPALKGRFDQRSYLSELDFLETASGEVVIVFPDKLRFEYLNPEPQTFYLVGNKYEVVQPEQRQILKGVLDQSTLARRALSLMVDPESALANPSSLQIGRCNDTESNQQMLILRDLVQGSSVVLAFARGGETRKNLMPIGFTSFEPNGHWTSVRLHEVSVLQDQTSVRFEPEGGLGYDIIDGQE